MEKRQLQKGISVEMAILPLKFSQVSDVAKAKTANHECHFYNKECFNKYEPFHS
jgi:hypothetical protein